MNKEIKEACDTFDESFEDALRELLDSGIDEDGIRAYFGPTALCLYILERRKEASC